MIQRIVTELGPWAWWVLGIVLLILEVLLPGVFLVWIGIAAIVTHADVTASRRADGLDVPAHVRHPHDGRAFPTS